MFSRNLTVHLAEAAFAATARRMSPLALPLLAALAFFPVLAPGAQATTLKVTTATLLGANLDAPYSATLAATGGTGTGYNWSVTVGTLPKGLTLTAATGAVSGKPTAGGVSSFTVEVKDSASNTATAKLSIAVNTVLVVTTESLPAGYLGVAYSQTLAAAAGSGTGYKWSITAGTLPTGLTLTAATGVISGKPTVKGSSKVIFKVTDSLAHTATATLTLAIDAALAISLGQLPEGYIGAKYAARLTATGGSGIGEIWSITTGALAPGLTLYTSGVIGGTPTGITYTYFGVTVKDSAGNTAKASMIVNVGYALEIATSALPVGYLHTSYSVTLGAQYGSFSGYKWSTSSKLPQNFTLTSAGVLSGTPLAVGTTPIVIKVVDSANNQATVTFSLIIDPQVANCTNDHPLTALVELHGVYTFTLNRYNLTNNQRYSSIGSFNADGLGNIKNGVSDANGAEFPAEVQNTFTGTYTVGSDGRGRLNLVISPVPAGGPTQNESFCFALDSFDKTGLSSHAAVIQDDTSNIVSSGQLYHQTLPTTLLAVKGPWVIGLAGRKENYTAGLPDFRHATVGYITFDGSGSISSGEVDQLKDVAGSPGVAAEYFPETLVTGSYTMPVAASGTPTGRGTMSVGEVGGKPASYVFYLAGEDRSGASRFVALETDTLGHPVLVGEGIRRTGPVSSASTGLRGSSVVSQYYLTDPGTAGEGEGTAISVNIWDGKGNFTYSGDSSENGVASRTAGSGTYSVDANGRFAVMQDGKCAPCGYLSINNQGFAISDSPEAPFFSLEFQDIPVGGNFQISSFLGGYSVGSRWFVFPDQQTTSGELISKGLGTIKGTLDQNRQGDTLVNQVITDTEATTTTSGADGRFLLDSGSESSAFYIVSPNEALSIPLTGTGTVTQPIVQYIHQ